MSKIKSFGRAPGLIASVALRQATRVGLSATSPPQFLVLALDKPHGRRGLSAASPRAHGSTFARLQLLIIFLILVFSRIPIE